MNNTEQIKQKLQAERRKKLAQEYCEKQARYTIQLGILVKKQAEHYFDPSAVPFSDTMEGQSLTRGANSLKEEAATLLLQLLDDRIPSEDSHD